MLAFEFKLAFIKEFQLYYHGLAYNLWVILLTLCQSWSFNGESLSFFVQCHNNQKQIDRKIRKNFKKKSFHWNDRLTLFRDNIHLAAYIEPIETAHRTWYGSCTKESRLAYLQERTALYTEHELGMQSSAILTRLWPKSLLESIDSLCKLLN